MLLTINIIITVLAILLYSGLFILVTTSKPQTELKRIFRYYLLAMIFWSLAAFLVYVDQARTLLWFRMMTVGGLLTVVPVFRFSRATINIRNYWDIVILIYAVACIVFSLSTDLVVRSAAVIGGGIDYELGRWVYLIGGSGGAIMFYSIGILTRSIRRSQDPIEQNRLRYLILGIGAMVLASTLNIPFPTLGKYPFDIATNSITAILFFFAILRYQLLDVRVVIRQCLVYSIPTIIIGTAYFLSINFTLNLFNVYAGIEIGIEVFMLSLLVAVLTAVIAEPLRVRAQRIIDRMFYREKYDSWYMLQNLSERVARVLDLYEITDLILTEVTSTLHIEKAAFFLKDEDSGKFQLTSQVGLDPMINTSFRVGHPLVYWLSTNMKSITTEEIEVIPQFHSMWKSERQDLDRMGLDLYIPICAQSQLIGIFTLGTKKSALAYNDEDRQTLTTVANQTAVAIENARLFTSEQNRRKEINTLYDLSHQLVDSDDLDTVLKVVTRHTVENIHVTYARILIKEKNGSYKCRSIYPESNLKIPLRLGRDESVVAEHFYNWSLIKGQSLVIDINSYELEKEEKDALFLNHASTLCLCPLRGPDENIGILVLGEFDIVRGEPFSTTGLRLINAIADYATSAIQRAMLHEQLEDNFLQTVVSLANAMDARDSYTGDHSQRMADMATRVGREMNLPETDLIQIHWASILHDIGKIGVPDEILNKKGPLTEEEWIIMKKHPMIGASIVAPVKFLSSVSPLIEAHHEKYDGTGYPNGLYGEDIPLGSRIISVVDAYVAIRDKRIYSESHTHEEAIAELRRFSGTQFDPTVVHVFCKTITE
jgi:HD-GYP domain-containing protein (c-di-GMP phosphodiesterase class II)